MVQIHFATNKASLQRSARPSKQANLSRKIFHHGRFIVVDPECYYQCSVPEIPASGHNIHHLFEDLLQKYAWSDTTSSGQTQVLAPLSTTRLIQT